MKKYSTYIVLFPFLIGILTLGGWIFSIDILKRPVYSVIAMNPVTALCFILCSTAFFLDFKTSFSNKISAISAVISMSVSAVGLLQMLTILRSNLHVDRWLFHDAVIAEIHRGHMTYMAHSTALGFVLIGLALRFGIVSTGRARVRCSYMAIAVFVIGLISFIGYLCHIRTFYDILRYLPMALQTATCFMCLSVAFLIENVDKGLADRTLTISQNPSNTHTQ